ncbi:MAG: hypothetical protein QOH00_1880 [Gaiellales bacterium]|jgi:hypothetical protein|nr:hypothetical protein [Gaiellales bacterium]
MTLERDLRALGAGFPDPPDLGARVLVAVREASMRRRRRRVAGLALALFLLVPATALAVSSDLRDRVLDSFGLRDVKIITVTRLPQAGPETRRLQLGTRISLARARTDLKLAVGPPAALGDPDGIFEERLKSGFVVTFAYEAATLSERIGVRRRVLVSIVRGTIDKTVLGKTIASATKAIPFRIEGGPALLLTGHPHLLVVFRARGGFDQTYTRFAGTTLLWQRRALLLRIEGNLPRARLVAIARSVTTG